MIILYSCLSRKVIKSTFLVIFAGLFAFSSVQGQYNAGLPASFGIDGDLLSDQRIAGMYPASGSHDWFYKKNGTGLGMFDVSDSTTIRNAIAANSNYTFLKRMNYPMYSVQNNYLLLDALYARDNFVSNAGQDKTAFVKGNKNSQDPSTWVTNPSGTNVTAKSDIIDAFIHMRRDGTSISSANPSKLILTVAGSILSTGGDHYLDFELFRNQLAYNSTTGTFNQIGPASTGGRNVWEFNADGSIKAFGELTISFSFNSSSISDIGIYIWVSKSTYQNASPRNFTFTDDWNASTTNPNYGYARIDKAGATTSWGTVNVFNTSAPAWGSFSKELGSTGSNYASDVYATGQFAEAAIDLTTMGVDPALGFVMDKCSAPFRRVMVKSRSSSSFSSDLQDFAGPYEFLDAPQASAEIATPSTLTCAQPSIQLAPLNNINGAYYTWTTTDGNILSGANTATPVIDKPGVYTLSAAIYQGCSETQASVTVKQDLYKPKSQVDEVGILTNAPGSSVVLKGGNTTSSNYPTPFGGSSGLLWNWTGPNGFTSTMQDVTVNEQGIYNLVVTEQRNGCKDTSSFSLLQQAVLPLRLRNFSGSLDDEKTELKWMVDENQTGNYFEVQQSYEGKDFKSIATVFCSERPGAEIYSINIKENSSSSYYRLLMVSKDNIRSYSKIIFVSGEKTGTTSLKLIQNPVKSTLRFSYQSVTSNEKHFVTIYDVRGVKIHQSAYYFHKGINHVNLDVNKVVNGHYYLEVSNDTSRNITGFIK